MDKNIKKLEAQELESVAGGWDGEYKYVDSYTCPNCGKLNTIQRYCTSGQSTWCCQKCGSTFTIRF